MFAFKSETRIGHFPNTSNKCNRLRQLEERTYEFKARSYSFRGVKTEY